MNSSHFEQLLRKEKEERERRRGVSFAARALTS